MTRTDLWRSYLVGSVAGDGANNALGRAGGLASYQLIVPHRWHCNGSLRSQRSSEGWRFACPTWLRLKKCLAVVWVVILWCCDGCLFRRVNVREGKIDGEPKNGTWYLGSLLFVCCLVARPSPPALRHKASVVACGGKPPACDGSGSRHPTSPLFELPLITARRSLLLRIDVHLTDHCGCV